MPFIYFVGGNCEYNVGNCGVFFLLGNRESLCWCLLFFLLVEIANLILVIGVFLELETTNRYIHALLLVPFIYFVGGNCESNVGNCVCFFFIGKL